MPNIEHAMRPATKVDHGEVTQRTLDYIEQLITLNEVKHITQKVNVIV